ncbi:MAG TPA: hypothetical protein VN805_01130 [Caulobacteraceae bacterium]|nr:hypothetical protein [Caulobacteraceae bacterium]
MRKRAVLIACLASLAACSAPPESTWAVGADATLIHCLNPASGTRWDVVIDPGRNLVDGFAARIGPNEVDWTDPTDQSHYELHRASGELFMTRPSSTGGYTNANRCASARKP